MNNKENWEINAKSGYRVMKTILLLLARLIQHKLPIILSTKANFPLSPKFLCTDLSESILFDAEIFFEHWRRLDWLK